MRFLVRFTPSTTPKEQSLRTARLLARSVSVEVRNPKWTSRGELEVDVFCPGRADFDLFLASVSPIFDVVFSRDLNVASPYTPEPELFDEAREYFNAERYWECHEVLEGVWRQKSGSEKSFLQGVILVCAAFVHHQKGEDSVALGVLRRAMPQLEFPGSSYAGFDVSNLRSNAEEILNHSMFVPFRV